GPPARHRARRRPSLGAAGGTAAMTILELAALTMVAVVAAAVVTVDDPLRQALVMSLYGFVLAVLFFVVQAPDVALSMIVVSTVAVPAMVLLALARVREVVPQGDEAPPGSEDDR